MLTRVCGVALVVAALCVPALATGGSNSDNECEFHFKLENPPILEVYCDGTEWRGYCGDQFAHHHVEVVTNSCTQLCWYWTDFKRQETDCDFKKLGTEVAGSVFFDKINAEVCLDVEDAFYTPALQARHCRPGDPDYSPNSLKTGPGECDAPPAGWKGGACEIESHNGGYTVHTRLYATGPRDVCDDAGCYTATLKVKVHIEHTESCEGVEGTLAEFRGVPHGT